MTYPSDAELAEAERLLEGQMVRRDLQEELEEERVFRLAELERHEVSVARATLDARLALRDVH